MPHKTPFLIQSSKKHIKIDFLQIIQFYKIIRYGFNAEVSLKIIYLYATGCNSFIMHILQGQREAIVSICPRSQSHKIGPDRNGTLVLGIISLNADIYETFLLERK